MFVTFSNIVIARPRCWDEMRADAGCVQGIICRHLVLPDIGDAHELAALGIVLHMDTMLDVGRLADADNLFRIALAAWRPLRETGAGLIRMMVSGSPRWGRSAAGKGCGRHVFVHGQG